MRTMLDIINKFNLDVVQLDVKTAFLNGTLENEILMEIPEGTNHSKQERLNKVCKLQRALYGLRISPKRWNEKFTEVALEIGLKNDGSEPCIFTWREKEKFLILLLYVDDILMTSNCEIKLHEIKSNLLRKFEMTDLGEPKEFLGISIKRDRFNRMTTLSQEPYIDKILERFGGNDLCQTKTPMETSQVKNKKTQTQRELRL